LIAALCTHIFPRDFMTFDQAVDNNTVAARRSRQMAGTFAWDSSSRRSVDDR
jgi:hypothetical protein